MEGEDAQQAEMQRCSLRELEKGSFLGKSDDCGWGLELEFMR